MNPSILKPASRPVIPQRLNCSSVLAPPSASRAARSRGSTPCSRHGCSKCYARGGGSADRRAGCSRRAIRSCRSRRGSSTAPATWRLRSPGSGLGSLPIRCGTMSPRGLCRVLSIPASFSRQTSSVRSDIVSLLPSARAEEGVDREVHHQRSFGFATRAGGTSGALHCLVFKLGE